MSRADFYVLAGYVALERATVGAPNQFPTNFVPKFGRENCPNVGQEAGTEDQPDETFPDAKWNFPREFEFSLRSDTND